MSAIGTACAAFVNRQFTQIAPHVLAPQKKKQPKGCFF
jgi:hypothetical protein